jgi:lysophospholipase L1-like esterase
MQFKNAELHNVRSMIPLTDGSGFRLSRVSESLRTSLNEGAQNTAFNTCGVEIRFNLVGDSAKAILKRCPRGEVPVDPAGVAEVWHGPFEGDWTICPRNIGVEPTEITLKRPANLELLQAVANDHHMGYDPALFRIILPYDWPTYLVDIQGEIAPPRPEQTPAKKMLAYGSSITHGGGAVRPTETYAMLSAAQLGCDLLNLGFAGSAQMEPELGRYIADEVEWDFATLEMGINVIGAWSVEKFRERAAGFIHAIAGAHPQKWVFCIDLFTFDGDLKKDPIVQTYREVVAEAVREQNLPHLVYLDGRTLLPSPVGLTADLVHPSSDGMIEIAKRLAHEIQKRF